MYNTGQKISKITHLTQVHNDTLVHFLPEVSSENLDERDLQSWDLAVHEDARQVQLHLETDVHLIESITQQ